MQPVYRVSALAFLELILTIKTVLCEASTGSGCGVGF